MGKPFSNKGKTQQSFAIFSREDPPHHRPSTQEGAYQNLEPSAQERCALQSYKHLLKFPNDKWESVILNGDSPLFIQDLTQQKVCLLAQ